MDITGGVGAVPAAIAVVIAGACCVTNRCSPWVNHQRQQQLVPPRVGRLVSGLVKVFRHLYICLGVCKKNVLCVHLLSNMSILSNFVKVLICHQS